MWISDQSKKMRLPRNNAGVGVVTAGGGQAGVYMDAERRWLPVMAPGGYRWRPKVGEQVLVIKTGADAESACILARQEVEEQDLSPGEVELAAQGCSIRLSEDGTVALRGTVTINGLDIESMVRAAVAQMLKSGEE